MFEHHATLADAHTAARLAEIDGVIEQIRGYRRNTVDAVQDGQIKDGRIKDLETFPLAGRMP